MERAVVQRCLEVDHGVARDGPLVGDVVDAFLDARPELARDRAAHDARLEGDATARVGLDLDPDMSELTAATGLLLVSALGLCPRSDGFAIGDAWRVRDD